MSGKKEEGAKRLPEYDNDDLFDDIAESRRFEKLDPGENDGDIPHGEVDFLHDVPLSMKAQIGSILRSVREILSLKTGEVIEFDKMVGEPMDVIVGGRLMWRGEIVVVNERYGIRISEVIRVEDSEKKLKPI